MGNLNALTNVIVRVMFTASMICVDDDSDDDTKLLVHTKHTHATDVYHRESRSPVISSKKPTGPRALLKHARKAKKIYLDNHAAMKEQAHTTKE